MSVFLIHRPTVCAIRYKRAQVVRFAVFPLSFSSFLSALNIRFFGLFFMVPLREYLGDCRTRLPNFCDIWQMIKKWVHTCAFLFLAIAAMGQFDFGEEDEKSNMRKWGSEHIRNYFSLSTGIALPVSDFNQTGQYSTQPGYAKAGYHVGAGVHYFIKQYFGVSGSFRYSSFQHNGEA